MILVFLISIIFILIDIILFIITSKPMSDEEEMEARVLLVSEKIKEIFK
jgi:hypothetical protein